MTGALLPFVVQMQYLARERVTRTAYSDGSIVDWTDDDLYRLTMLAFRISQRGAL